MYSCWSVLLSNCHGFWHFGSTSTVRAPCSVWGWGLVARSPALFTICFSWWRVWGATTETSGQLIKIAVYCGQKIFQDTWIPISPGWLIGWSRPAAETSQKMRGCATTLRVIMNYMVLVYFSRVGGPTTSHDPTPRSSAGKSQKSVVVVAGQQYLQPGPCFGVAGKPRSKGSAGLFLLLGL